MVDLPLSPSQSKALPLNSPSSPYIQYHYVSFREVLPLGWRLHTQRTWVWLQFVPSVLCFRWYFRSVLGHLFLLCIFLPHYCCLVIVLCGCICMACLPPHHPFSSSVENKTEIWMMALHVSLVCSMQAGAWLSSYSPVRLLLVAVTSDSSCLEWQSGQNHNSVTWKTWCYIVTFAPLWKKCSWRQTAFSQPHR